MSLSIQTRPPAAEVMRSLGLDPDPWQLEVLDGRHARLLLNCCRQAGKSTVVAMLGLVEAIWEPGTKVLLVSRSQRQSSELFRIMTDAYRKIDEPLKERLTASELVLTNESRIVCLPCREDTIRGYAKVNYLVIDEAARVPDDIYRAVRPMLAVSAGRLICLSTPYGKRGFFWNAWARGGDDWTRVEVPAQKVTRIPTAFLEQERRAYGDSYYRQEYECSFESLEGLVFPDFSRCVVPVGSLQSAVGSGQLALESKHRTGIQSATADCRLPTADCLLPSARWVGGIDFGFRNPFAALWGILDNDDVLWLVGEHYARQKPLSYNAERIPKRVTWYADPSGAMERCELRKADFVVRQGKNALQLGIAAVTARLANGTLKVLEGRCPNLLHEAGLYRWDDSATERDSETPVDAHNHALSALRYLVASLDAGKMARKSVVSSQWSVVNTNGRAEQLANDC